MNNDEWLQDHATRMGEIINLPNVTHVYACARDTESGRHASGIYRVGDVVDVRLNSQEALIKVLLEVIRDCGEVRGCTFIGRLKKGATDGVEPDSLVSFREYPG